MGCILSIDSYFARKHRALRRCRRAFFIELPSDCPPNLPHPTNGCVVRILFCLQGRDDRQRQPPVAACWVERVSRYLGSLSNVGVSEHKVTVMSRAIKKRSAFSL